MRDLDINQVPSGGAEEEWMTMNMDDEDESSNGGPPRKKLRLTKEQSRLLEESFRQNHTLNPVINLSIIYDCIFFLIVGRLSLINPFGFWFCAETERGFGYAIEAEATASWGVVSEP